MNRKIGRLFATVGALTLACAVAPASASAEFGIVPGSFVAKTHATIPLLSFPSEPDPHNKRSIDIVALEAAPPVAAAGAHPDASASFEFIRKTPETTDGNAKDIIAGLPPGFIGNPETVPACSRDAFEITYINIKNRPTPTGCSPTSQVGVVTVNLGGFFGDHYTSPIYRIAAPAGAPAAFGFQATAFGIVLEPSLRSDGDYGLAVTVTDANGTVDVLSSAVTFWGVPADPIHDPERWDGITQAWGVSSGLSSKPFLSNPTYCDSGVLTTSLSMNSWQEMANWVPTGPDDPRYPDYQAEAPEPTGCEELEFGTASTPASLQFQPTVHAGDTPSGYDVKLKLPYNDSPTKPSNPVLRDTVVTLPEGVVLNPAAANGLDACTADQIGFVGSGFPLPNPIRFDSEHPQCPDSSKIGTVDVHSPLLEEPLSGAVYIAKQLDNPFGSLLAIYIVIDDAKTGLMVKLAGHVEADPQTGRLTTTFADNPQLPFTEFDLHFFNGPRAALVNPLTCGTWTTSTELTPWSAPHTGPPVVSNDSFAIESGPNGAPCLASESQAPSSPSFEAGVVTPTGGIYSPFVLRMKREDGTQELRAVDLELPPGLSGRLAGVQRCSEASIAGAEARTAPGDGALELGSPSCPDASRLGTVDVAAGAGSAPMHVPGKVYLAGPYKGAPLSVAIVTPAVAGPFDLGVVVVRSALYVDPRTARITAKSDPIPNFLKVAGNGFPLKVRSVSLDMDRPEFTRNPSNCDPMKVDGSVYAAFASTPVSSPFQVGACNALEFSPKLGLRLFGGVKRAKYQRFRAVLEAGPGEANISRASVKLPSSAFLAQEHIGTVCTRVQFSEDRCPEKAIYGRATAWSPLLDIPLTGPVYLRSSTNLLPDLVVDLRGTTDLPLKIELVGRTDAVKGALRNTFDVVPDVPVTKFVLELFGGDRSLVVNSRNICLGNNRANVMLDAHNGKIHDFRPRVRNSRCSKQKKAKRARAAHRRAARTR